MNTRFKTTTKVMIVVCFIGLSLLLYPTFSNYWNSKHATRAINTFVESISKIDESMYREVWDRAAEYNADLLKRDNVFSLTDEMRTRYYENLDVSGTGAMGYIEIPKIGVALPIYHGTSDRVLQHAVGHLEWSSLPVGGESTHCVVSGHRGLPSAKLFTELDKLREGDTFTMMVLNNVLTYEVDQIRTVEPTDVNELLISEGKDYCTLVTCTPYGINTHRLLIRGHRIESASGTARVISEAVIVDELIVASVVAFPILFILLMAVMLKKPKNRPEPNDRDEAEKDKPECAAAEPDEPGSDASECAAPEPDEPGSDASERAAPEPDEPGSDASECAAAEPDDMDVNK